MSRRIISYYYLVQKEYQPEKWIDISARMKDSEEAIDYKKALIREAKESHKKIPTIRVVEIQEAEYVIG